MAQSPNAKHARKPPTRTAQTRRRPPDITYSLAILRHDAGSCASNYSCLVAKWRATGRRTSGRLIAVDRYLSTIRRPSGRPCLTPSVTQTFASWNQIAGWLRQLERFRSAA
jgi:hypothetical protein